MRFFGLEEDYVLIGPEGESIIGMTRSRLLDRVGGSAFLLNIMGYLRDEDVLAVPRDESSWISIRVSASSGMNWACIARSRATMPT